MRRCIGILFLVVPLAMDALAQTQIGCGQTLTGAITTGGQVDAYTFSGIAGEAVVISVARTAGSLSPIARLHDPADNLLASSVLPATGSYTIRISDIVGASTGTYNLNLQFATGRCASSITCGQTLGGDIAVPAKHDAYSFNGTAGEAVVISAVRTAGSVSPIVRLHDPAGGLVASSVLPSTGAYTIVISDIVGASTGTYNLNLQFATGRCASSISCGQTLGGDIAVPAKHDAYSFNGTAGEAVVISAVRTAGSVSPIVRLHDPAGGLVASSVLPSTGTYTIVISDIVGASTGTYNLNLQFATGRCASSISCGQTLGGDIAVPAKHDAYSFNGTAGEAVVISAVRTAGSVSPIVRLHDPAGGLVASSVLPSTGTYTIVISDIVGASTGTYNLNLQFATGRCASSISCGQTLGGDIAVPAKHDAYSFNGTAGEAVVISAVRTAGSVSPIVRLHDPAGGLVASSVLPSTGTYTIVISDIVGASTGTYNLNLQFATGRCALPIACRQPLCDSISAPAEHDGFTFSGASGETVGISVVKTSGALSPIARVHDPNGGLVAGTTLPSSGTFTVLVSDIVGASTGSYNLKLTQSACPALRYFTVSPCRVVDTREPNGSLGGPPLGAGADRVFKVAETCQVPPSAKAVTINVAVTQSSGSGDIRIFPACDVPPLVSTLNYSPGQTRANNTTVGLSASGELTVGCAQASGTVHFILDVTGYFE